MTTGDMDLELMLWACAKGGGVSRFHLAMMPKAFVHGCMTQTFPPRMIAKALRENAISYGSRTDSNRIEPPRVCRRLFYVSPATFDMTSGPV